MVEPIQQPNGPQIRASDASVQKLVIPALSDRTYRGCREPDGSCVVWVEETVVSVIGDAAIGSSTERALPLQLEIRGHSPTGFQWGYSGSGPAQLALALLADALGETEHAQMHYQDFKREFVSGWGDSWSITASEIRGFVVRNAGH